MKSRSPIRPVMALTIALLAAGCAGGGMYLTTHIDQNPGYSPSLVLYAIGDGELATEIHGRAFMKAPMDGEAIASRLALPGWFPPARLTTRPSEEGRMAYNNSHRLVLFFNPERPVSGGILCTAPEKLTSHPDAVQLRVQAAFCSGDEVTSEAYGRGPVASDSRDPALQKLLDQMLLDLFPPRNPMQDPDMGYLWPP